LTVDKSEDPAEVMHYTSVSGFKGIVETGTLHATAISYLNDRKELRFVDEFIRDDIVGRFAEVFEDVRTQGLFEKEPDIGGLSEHEGDNFLRSIHVASGANDIIFVCSFCRAEDNDVAKNGLLSQWRAYGRDGGIAIYFDRIGIESILSNEISEFVMPNAFFGDVIYGRDDREFEEIEPEFENFYKAVPDIVESIMKDGGIDYVFTGEKVSVNEIWLPYFHIAPRLKHPGFREELEYRLAVTVSVRELSEGETKKKKKVLFRISNNYLVPYIIFNEFEDSKLPITRVIVGPSVESQRRLESVKLLLTEHGYDVPVVTSNIPYA
jgi:hypothetical protein